MKNWIRTFLGLDTLQEANQLNQKNHHHLEQQNKILLAELKDLKKNPLKTEIRYLQSDNNQHSEIKEVNLPVINTFSLQNQKKVNSLEFSLVNKDILSKQWNEIASTQASQHQMKSMMSSLTSGGVALQGAATQSTKGLFQATVSPDKLMTYNNGTVSSIVKDASGKIQEHSGFTQAGNAAFNPLLVMQFASILTGQYYFNGITNQLNLVLDKLDNLQRMHHIEREAKMKYAFNQLQIYSNKKAFTIEDFVNLKHISYDLQVIRDEYLILSKETIVSIESFVRPINLEKEEIKLVLDEANQLEKTLSSVKGNINNTYNKITSSKFGTGIKSMSNSVGRVVTNSKGKVEKISEKIKEMAPYYTFKSAITAEELYQISRLVELKMNLAVKEISEDRVYKIREIKEELVNFKKEELLHFKLDEMVKSFENIVQNRFMELKSESNIDRNAIQGLIQDSKQEFDLLNKINRQSIETVENLNIEAVRSFDVESEVLLDNRGMEPRLFIKQMS